MASSFILHAGDSHLDLSILLKLETFCSSLKLYVATPLPPSAPGQAMQWEWERQAWGVSVPGLALFPASVGIYLCLLTFLVYKMRSLN